MKSKHANRFVAILAVMCLTAPLTTAQETSVKPGINKPFQNPMPEDFLDKFEGESREIAAQAKQIVAACQLKPGMIVADVGAGTGLFTRKFAAAVGDKGKVIAVDIAPPFLKHIEKTCAAAKITNVETVLCDQFSTKLPKNSVDLVFICDTYHHFEFPQRTMQSIHDALRPGGRIVLVELEKIEGKSSAWVMGHVRAGKEVFVREIKTAGFQVVDEETFLKENYLIRFQKTDDKADKKRGRTLEQMQKSLDKSLTPAKAIAAFGEPDARPGSGLIIFEYNLDDGSRLMLGFPGFAAIVYARHVTKDGQATALPIK